MNITCNRLALIEELRVLDKIAAEKSSIPVLSNVLMEATGRLRLTATDLEVGLTTFCEAEIQAPGAVTLPVNKLLTILRQLDDEDITIDVNDKEQCHVKAGKFKSRLQTWNARDFPTMPAVATAQAVISMDGAALRELIIKTRYAISDKNAMYLVNGGLLSFANGTVGMVTTDGKRLSIATKPWNTPGAESLLLPAKTLDVLLTLLDDETIQILQAEHHLFFTFKDRVLFSRTIDGKFPSYASVVPKDNNHVCTADNEELRDILKRVGTVANKDQIVTLTFTPSTLEVMTRNHEVGEATEQLVVAYDGPEVKMNVNYTHVLAFLGAAKEELVSLRLKDSNSPLMMTDGLETNFINVILGQRT